MTGGATIRAHEAPSAGQAAPAVQIEGLEKSYASHRGEAIRALGPLSFSVPDGGFLTIVGPSGCGKSTVLRLLSGLIERTAGTMRVRGQEVDATQGDIGFVFQSPTLLPWKTAMENVLLPADVLRLDRAASRSRARMLLDLVGLGDFAERYPRELSGGMQQRVSIARALIHDPSILLMDEPFGALDAMTRETMSVELLRIWQRSRKTVLFVTHSIPEAVFLGTHILVLTPRPGRIADFIEPGLPADRTLDVMSTPAFGEIVKRIRHHFQVKGGME